MRKEVFSRDLLEQHIYLLIQQIIFGMLADTTRFSIC